MAVPYTFGAATSSIPLSQLDSNFATTITLGNTAIQLGNTVTTLNNMTLANVTVSSGTVTLPAQQANAVVYLNSSNVVTANASVLSVVGGNLGIGTTSPSVASGKGIVIFGTAGQARLALKNNATGDASTDGFQLVVGTDSSAFIEQRENAPMIFTTNDTERARITSGGNLQFITADAGIVFNKTGALTNSTLNDYEEGTWTPSLSNGTYTFSSQLGTYTKVGRLVTACCFIQISAISGTGTSSAEITGLPFTSLNNNSTYGGQSVNVDALNADHTQVGVQVVPNSTYASLIANIGKTGGHTGLQSNWLTSTSVVRAVLVYQAA